MASFSQNRRLLASAGVLAVSLAALAGCGLLLGVGGEVLELPDAGVDARTLAEDADADADAEPPPDAGNTYYVSTAGNDSNSGSSSAPWLTIQHAGALVTAGDTVIVRAGTYDGAIFCYYALGTACLHDECSIAGTAAHPIVFRADATPDAGPVVIGGKNKPKTTGFDLEPGCNYIDIVGFTVTGGGTADEPDGGIARAGISVAQCNGNQILDNTVRVATAFTGILVDNSSDVVVRGNEVANTYGKKSFGPGIYVSGSSSGVHVLRNLVHDNVSGILVDGDVSEGQPGVAQSLVLAGNTVYDNRENGIDADGLQISRLENNLVYRNGGDGVTLYQTDALGGSVDNVLVNNTIDQSMVAGAFAVSVQACTYDNQSAAATPAGCSTPTADTSLGNVAFDNVLLGGLDGGATEAVSADDSSASTNITAATAALFIDGTYQLAPNGPGVGHGVAAFGDASASAAPGGGYDVGAFDFAP